jgi:hypothetical protein
MRPVEVLGLSGGGAGLCDLQSADESSSNGTAEWFTGDPEPLTHSLTAGKDLHKW